jgi:hypothetical protein
VYARLLIAIADAPNGSNVKFNSGRNFMHPMLVGAG